MASAHSQLPTEAFYPPTKSLSLVFGSQTPALWTKTLGSLIQDQARDYGDREAVIVPWQSMRLTYQDLADRSAVVAKGMLEMGVRYGDCVGIIAGNCYQYIEVFLGAARIGCPVVVLNNTYSPDELKQAVMRSDCKLLFLASTIGSRDLSKHIQVILDLHPSDCALRWVVCLGTEQYPTKSIDMQSYSSFLEGGHSIFINDRVLKVAERRVQPSDVLNLQFTSGTTGLPKAATLTHMNLINDGRFVGQAMELTAEDVVCCPPPLFHCFGLVMGFLASFCHGSAIIFPSDSFDAKRVLSAVVQEKATALLGVPTMFFSELEAVDTLAAKIDTVRTGLVAGSPVPPSLIGKLRDKMNVRGLLIAYGMTETSPVTFITSLTDPEEKMINSLGKVLPHTGAKIVDPDGRIVPRGVRGEICTSGFALQKGYWKDEAKTHEVMRADDNGIVWMHTGDEGFIDDQGYGHIAGRIKDLIIRGGENISPSDIEDRLLQHPSIGECCVVGLEDKKYGEVVASFLRTAEGSAKVSDAEVRTWVTQKFGRIKAPAYIFWVGDSDVGSELPKTGSGKYQKHLIREMGNRIVKRRSRVARL